MKILNRIIFKLVALCVILTLAFMCGEILAEIKFDELYESGLIDQDVYERYYNEQPDSDLDSDTFDLDTDALKYIKV